MGHWWGQILFILGLCNFKFSPKILWHSPPPLCKYLSKCFAVLIGGDWALAWKFKPLAEESIKPSDTSCDSPAPKINVNY